MEKDSAHFRKIPPNSEDDEGVDRPICFELIADPGAGVETFSLSSSTNGGSGSISSSWIEVGDEQETTKVSASASGGPATIPRDSDPSSPFLLDQIHQEDEEAEDDFNDSSTTRISHYTHYSYDNENEYWSSLFGQSSNTNVFSPTVASASSSSKDRNYEEAYSSSSSISSSNLAGEETGQALPRRQDPRGAEQPYYSKEEKKWIFPPDGQNKATIFHGSDQQLFHMQEYLIANGISSSRGFQNKRIPQFQADIFRRREEKNIINAECYFASPSSELPIATASLVEEPSEEELIPDFISVTNSQDNCEKSSDRGLRYGNGNNDSLSTRLFDLPAGLEVFRGDFDAAIHEAKYRSRLLLVNIQDYNLFSSHTLIRDVFSDELIQGLIATQFVLWQPSIGTKGGSEYSRRFHIKQEQLPLLSVIHPTSKTIIWSLTSNDNHTWNQSWSADDIAQSFTEICFDWSCNEENSSTAALSAEAKSSVHVDDGEDCDNNDEKSGTNTSNSGYKNSTNEDQDSSLQQDSIVMANEFACQQALGLYDSQHELSGYDIYNLELQMAILESNGE